MSEEMVPLRKNIKKGLGRGLGSLLGEVEATHQPTKTPAVEESRSAAPGDRIFKIAIEKVIANQDQPRKNFSAEKLQELAQSIKEKGVILPIVVRQASAGKFEIVAGERRWRAAQIAGLLEVPVLIRQYAENEALEVALIENIQRHDLNPMEEAEAYGLLIRKYGLTQNQVAEKVGKDRSSVANLLRLILLAPEVKKMLSRGEISFGQAKILLSLSDPTEQTQVAQKTVKQKLSVRALERFIQKLKNAETVPIESEPTTWSANQMAPLISELQRMFGTKTEITPLGSGGKVSFYFYSAPELNQFLDKLRKTRV